MRRNLVLLGLISAYFIATNSEHNRHTSEDEEEWIKSSKWRMGHTGDSHRWLSVPKVFQKAAQGS